MSEEKNKPYQVDCEPGTHAWCMCGLSSKLPYCDGTHEKEGTGKEPHIHIVGKPIAVFICACGKSDRKPYCDGSHNNPNKQ